MMPPTGDHDLRARLRDVEALLDAITDHGIIQLDLDGNIVRWSAG